MKDKRIANLNQFMTAVANIHTDGFCEFWVREKVSSMVKTCPLPVLESLAREVIKHRRIEIDQESELN